MIKDVEMILRIDKWNKSYPVDASDSYNITIVQSKLRKSWDNYYRGKG